MSVFRVEGLEASVNGHEILRGVDLEIRSGEVHALMGPNGSGKSTLAHVLMGRGDYAVTAGSVRIDDEELLGRPTWARAEAGLFLAMQYPVEVPGVSVRALLAAAGAANGGRLEAETARLAVPAELVERGVNDGFSGGEKKRMETLQLAVLTPRFAVLDEVDSGLDVDALADVSRRIEAMTNETALGVLAITHYSKLFDELAPDRVHVLMAGRIVASGGPELAGRLEEIGYEGLAAELGVESMGLDAADAAPDPFADPGF